MAQQAELLLQIVTNLGTRLLTTVPASFSVSDAKRKIESDHLEPLGEIRILQLKVEHMGHMYCLPDDMSLADAFAGSTGSRFKPVVVEAVDGKVGAVNTQGSEANAANATGENEAGTSANVASDDSKKKKKKKKKKTKKRSHSSAAE